LKKWWIVCTIWVAAASVLQAWTIYDSHVTQQTITGALTEFECTKHKGRVRVELTFDEWRIDYAKGYESCDNHAFELGERVLVRGPVPHISRTGIVPWEVIVGSREVLVFEEERRDAYVVTFIFFPLIPLMLGFASFINWKVGRWQGT
jgi:hypothetical protein